MGCCGQGRAGLRAATPHLAEEPRFAAAPPPAIPTPERRIASSGAEATTRVRYTASLRVRVRGPASGREYEFSGDEPFAHVDPRDAEGLVGTGLFHRVF